MITPLFRRFYASPLRLSIPAPPEWPHPARLSPARSSSARVRPFCVFPSFPTQEISWVAPCRIALLYCSPRQRLRYICPAESSGWCWASVRVLNRSSCSSYSNKDCPTVASETCFGALKISEKRSRCFFFIPHPVFFFKRSGNDGHTMPCSS